MRKFLLLTAAAVALGASVAGAQPKKDIGYDPLANAFEQRDAAVARAAAEDKLLLLISGGDWCSWCHYLADFLERDKALDAALHEVFVKSWPRRTRCCSRTAPRATTEPSSRLSSSNGATAPRLRSVPA